MLPPAAPPLPPYVRPAFPFRPYPFDQRAAWLNLTNCVTDPVLERCGVPVGAKVLAGSSAAEAGELGGTAEGDESGVSEGGGGAGSGMDIVPHFPHVGRVARFCHVPVRRRRRD